MVREGTFRVDLYFRLNLFVITIPPLRERREDILPLARILAGRFALEQGGPEPRFSPEVDALLTAYPWPGNIRELENAVHYAVTMAEGERLIPWHLPDAVRLGRSPFLPASEATPGSAPATAAHPTPMNGQFPVPIDLSLPLAEIERRHILAVYEAHSRNKTHTAKALGISVRSLQLKLAAWGSPGK
jgi:DNA-binding NtrC family response regulator